MLSLKNQIYTLEEYLELDHASEEKIEFWDGHIFTLAGASNAHDRIQGNGYFALRSKLQGRKCRVFLSEMRVDVPAYPPYRYPDLSALCGEARFKKLGNQEILVNPQLIVEILSESTAEFDRGYKFTYYKSIESFVEYVLIAQDRPHVSQFVKQADNSWLNHEFNSLEDEFYLPSLDCRLELLELYQDVEFPEIDRRYRLELIAE
jgi:Uma2 family endonuclease